MFDLLSRILRRQRRDANGNYTRVGDHVDRGSSPTPKGRLITVAEHEAKRAAGKFDKTPGNPSGVACPGCGAELYYFIGGTRMLDAHGGRKPVFCRACCHETTLA